MIEQGDGEMQRRIDSGRCPSCRSETKQQSKDEAQCIVCGLVITERKLKDEEG